VRILDLISEGEIEGLVAGHQSIYYNGVPLQNENGTYNFKDVAVDYRYGTQTQTPVNDLDGVENVRPVGIKILKATPIYQNVDTTGADVLYATFEIPQLTNQNTSNGDINGSSVEFTLEVKSSTDTAYRFVPIGTNLTSVGTFSGTYDSAINGWSNYKEPLGCTSSTLRVVWRTSSSTVQETVVVRISYRKVGVTAWTVFGERTIRGKASVTTYAYGYGLQPWQSTIGGINNSTVGTPQNYVQNILIPHPLGQYEYKVEFNGVSTGSVAIGI
jgi:hypothetical protein